MEEQTNIEKLGEKVSLMLEEYYSLKNENETLTNEVVTLKSENEIKEQEIARLADENAMKDLEIEEIVTKIENILG